MDYKNDYYYKFRQIFSDYILIYKSILFKKKYSDNQISFYIIFIVYVLECHYFYMDYHINERLSLFDNIKWFLIEKM